MTVAAGNLCRDRLSRRHIAIENRNPGARGGEGAAGRGADPVPTAGDQSDPSGKIFGHGFPFVSRTPRLADRGVGENAELPAVRLAQALRCEDLTTEGESDDP